MTITVPPASVNGGRFGFSDPGSGPVGGSLPDIMNDGNDATYVQANNPDELVFEFPAAGNGSGTVADVTVFIRVSVNNVTTPANRFNIALGDATGSDDTFAIWTVSIPDANTWYDLPLVLGPTAHPTLGSITYWADGHGHSDGDSASLFWSAFQNKTSGSWTTDGTDNDDPWAPQSGGALGLLALLAAGNLEFDVPYNEAADFKVSELTITIPSSGAQPPLRQHPRTDGLGASSATRHYPPSRSAQASNRRAGGYI